MAARVNISNLPNLAITALADVARVVAMFSGPKWGIFTLQGKPFLTGDSVRAIDQRAEWQVPHYQMELGGFSQYNKVALPGDIRISMLVGGVYPNGGAWADNVTPANTLLGGVQQVGGGIIAAANGVFGTNFLGGGQTASAKRRFEFLQQLQRAANSLELFAVVTPELTMSSLAITRFEFGREREEGGASLLPVEVFLVEIRQIGQGTPSDTKTAAGQAATPQGTVQPSAPTAQQAANAVKAPGT